jgi:hypothetical protein
MIVEAFFSVMVMTSSPYRPVPADESSAAERADKPHQHLAKGKARGACDSPQGIAGLPFAHGRRFCALDDYLGHLENHAGPIGQPWWKEVRPGVFQHMTTATNARRETATRAELMKRFGFSQ